MKRILILLMVLCLLLTGCAKAPAEEEGAVADTVVEGEAKDTPAEQDKPEIVPESPVTEKEDDAAGNTPTETPGTTEEEQPAAPTDTQEPDTPSDNQSNDTPAVNTSKTDYNFKIMTFNVRCTDDPNGHSIQERAPRVKATIEKHDPDIVGMQEVVPAWHTIFTETMTEKYEVITHYRSATNLEGLTILYKKGAFELIDEDFFWCSETPEKESKGWGATFPRICTWARLKHKSTGREIIFFNFHGEYNDTFAEGSCNLILKEASRYPKAAAFLLGDFNLSTSMSGYTYFASYFDEARTILNDPTSGIFEGTRPGGYPNPGAAEEVLSAFDYVFHQEDKAEAVDYIIDRTRFDGYFASDHYAVIGCYKL
ncbi:MAG: endonuclease/exonuclease/phosphatase family protein [Clostridia bacterium]|nr:endonuclease/exonuclease/phosphatase family protein [Clostridia bacterium]